MARQRHALENELEDQLEAREHALRREVREAYEERLLTLQDDLQAALARRDQLETLLLSLVTQLVGERKRYLADTHITSLDLTGLNQALAPHGLRVRGEYRPSERQVVCQLANGARQMTVFWREGITPGVVDEA